jgi:hypothetical protein
VIDLSIRTSPQPLSCRRGVFIFFLLAAIERNKDGEVKVNHVSIEQNSTIPLYIYI